jgi:hypothetical protein
MEVSIESLFVGARQGRTLIEIDPQNPHQSTARTGTGLAHPREDFPIASSIAAFEKSCEKRLAQAPTMS